MSGYSILFNIVLQHEYFSNGKCSDFEILPAADCFTLLKKLNIQLRNTGNGLVALIKENETHQPYINTPDARHYHDIYDKTVFRFFLKLKNPLFLNYTSINAACNNNNKFYFSNRAQNYFNNARYLSTAARAFGVDTQYFPGDLATETQTGKVYESLTKYTGKKKSELSDPALWAPKDFQYASEKDMVVYTSGNYTFQLSEAANKAKITILGFNYQSPNGAYDLPAGEIRTQTFDDLTGKVTVNLAGLPPGKYVINVNDESETVYYNPSVSAADIFGVIEIFNFLPGDAEYSLLDKDEKIKHVTYHICFPARRVLWKYKRKDGKAEAITDIGDNRYKFNLTGDEFISSVPIPFSQNPLKTLKLEFNTSDYNLFPLPNPPLDRLSKFTQNNYDYFCSEVNLNY
jgi:hypothetical protein